MLIAHIADLHVSDDGLPVHDLVDTDAATRAVVAALNALDPAPNVIIAAGDLTHDGDGVAAARAKALLGGLPAPVLVCTGNHDRAGRRRSRRDRSQEVHGHARRQPVEDRGRDLWRRHAVVEDRRSQQAEEPRPDRRRRGT